MFKKMDRNPAIGQEIAAVSLIAMVACAFAGDALASPSPAEPTAALSARVAAVVERISLGEPALVRDLTPERKIAWRNR